MNRLFGKPEPKKTPREQVREWKSALRKEQRVLDRQLRSIKIEEEKVKRSLKDAAKKGQKDVCTILAKEMVHSRKAVNKIYASKAQMNSVMMSMQNQLATARMAGALQASTDVMRSMNALLRVPEIAAAMQDLSKEMMKAGLIEEMVEDAFESLEDEETEEAAQVEVDKILFEVTNGMLGQAGAVDDTLPAVGEPGGAEAAAASAQSDEEDEMAARLEALRS